jgi:hypothetical protein
MVDGTRGGAVGREKDEENGDTAVRVQAFQGLYVIINSVPLISNKGRWLPCLPV